MIISKSWRTDVPIITIIRNRCTTKIRRNYSPFAQRKKIFPASLAERSTVPEPTIKKFETTGQISLRQFILLWQCVDELERLAGLCEPAEVAPRSIAEVLGRC